MEEKYDLFILERDLIQINKKLRLKSLPRYKQLELVKSLNKLMTFLGNNLDEMTDDDHYIIKNSLLVYFSVMKYSTVSFLPKTSTTVNRNIRYELGNIQKTYDGFKDHPKIKELKFSEKFIL